MSPTLIFSSLPSSPCVTSCKDFEFGFGMSYTTFAYSALHVKEIENGFAKQEVRDWEASKPGASGEGSSVAVW